MPSDWVRECARKLVAAEDQLVLEAHQRAQELGMGVLVKKLGQLEVRHDGDYIAVTALTEAGPDPSVPMGQIHYAPKEDS